MTPIDDRPTLAEILAACLAVQAIYAERDAAAAARAQAAGTDRDRIRPESGADAVPPYAAAPTE